MELRHLRYLLAIADEGHFTRAAQRLHVSQPALSQQIRQLEDGLGATLLDRAGRRVRLTAAGEIVVHHARRMLNEMNEAQVALQELAGLQRGALAIGTVQTVNAYLMPQVVAQFANAYPAIHVRIEELSADAIEQGLQQGTLQLGIGFVPSATADIEAEPLFDEELVLIVPQEHPFAERAVVDTREVNGLPLVLLSSAFCTRRLWDSCAREAAIQPHVQVEMNTIAGVLASVRRTHAATILPSLALASEPAHGLVGIRLRNPTPCRTVGLLWRRRGYRCAATQAFAQTFQDVLAVVNTSAIMIAA